MEATRILEVTVADVSNDVERALSHSEEMPPCSSIAKATECNYRSDCSYDTKQSSCQSNVVDVDVTCSEARSEAFAYLPDACSPGSSPPEVCDICKITGGIFDPSRDSNFNGLSCGQVQAGIAFTDDCPSRQREFGEACCNTDPIVCDIAQSGELIPGAVAFVHECVDSGGSRIVDVHSYAECSLAGGTPVEYQTCQEWQLAVNKEIMSSTSGEREKAKECSANIFKLQRGGGNCATPKLEKCNICLKGMEWQPDATLKGTAKKCSEVLADVSYLRGEHCAEEGKKYMKDCCKHDLNPLAHAIEVELVPALQGMKSVKAYRDELEPASEILGTVTSIASGISDLKPIADTLDAILQIGKYIPHSSIKRIFGLMATMTAASKNSLARAETAAEKVVKGLEPIESALDMVDSMLSLVESVPESMENFATQALDLLKRVHDCAVDIERADAEINAFAQAAAAASGIKMKTSDNQVKLSEDIRATMYKWSGKFITPVQAAAVVAAAVKGLLDKLPDFKTGINDKLNQFKSAFDKVKNALEYFDPIRDLFNHNICIPNLLAPNNVNPFQGTVSFSDLGCFTLQGVIEEVTRMIRNSPAQWIVDIFEGLVEEAIDKSGVGAIFNQIKRMAESYANLRLPAFPNIMPTINLQLEGLTNMQTAAKEKVSSLVNSIMSMSDLFTGPEFPSLPGLCSFDAEMDDDDRRLLLANGRQLSQYETKSKKVWMSQKRDIFSMPSHIKGKLLFLVWRYFSSKVVFPIAKLVQTKLIGIMKAMIKKIENNKDGSFGSKLVPAKQLAEIVVDMLAKNMITTEIAGFTIQYDHTGPHPKDGMFGKLYKKHWKGEKAKEKCDPTDDVKQDTRRLLAPRTTARVMTVVDHFRRLAKSKKKCARVQRTSSKSAHKKNTCAPGWTRDQAPENCKTSTKEKNCNVFVPAEGTAGCYYSCDPNSLDLCPYVVEDCMTGTSVIQDLGKPMAKIHDYGKEGLETCKDNGFGLPGYRRTCTREYDCYQCTECETNFYVKDGECAPKRSEGETCTADDECKDDPRLFCNPNTKKCAKPVAKAKLNEVCDPDSKKDRNLACEGKLKCVDGKCKGDKLGKGEGPCVTSADCESDDLKCDDKTSKCVSEVKQPFPPKTVLPDNAKLQLWLGLNKDAFHIPDLECDGDEGYLVRRTKVDIYYDGDANTQYQCKDTILEECRADWDLVTAASEIKFGGKRGEWGPSSELSTTTMGTKANHPAYKDPYFTITKITKTCTAKCKEERQNKKCCSCTYSVEDSMFKESSPGFGTAGDQSVSYKGNLVDYIEVNVGDKDMATSGHIVVSVLGKFITSATERSIRTLWTRADKKYCPKHMEQSCKFSTKPQVRYGAAGESIR